MLRNKENSKLQLRKSKLDNLTMQNRLNYKKVQNNPKFEISKEELEKMMAPEAIEQINKGTNEDKLNILLSMISQENNDVKMYALLKLEDLTENSNNAIMNKELFDILMKLVVSPPTPQVKVNSF